MKSQAHDDDCKFTGTLERSESGRWVIKTEEGRLIEITSGEMIEVNIGGHWFRSRIECGPEGYYAVVPGIQLYRGMDARQ